MNLRVLGIGGEFGYEQEELPFLRYGSTWIARSYISGGQNKFKKLINHVFLWQIYWTKYCPSKVLGQNKQNLKKIATSYPAAVVSTKQREVTMSGKIELLLTSPKMLVSICTGKDSKLEYLMGTFARCRCFN